MPCSICNDTQWKSIDLDGVERVVRCYCWRDALVERALAECGLPPGYRHCELTNFDTRGADPLIQALALARKFAEKFPVFDKGLFLLGPTGVGKTHLSAGVLKAVIRNTAARGYFFKTGELLQQIRNTYNKSVEETELGVLEPIFNAELLVLDDVGLERPTDWVQETLGILIDRRYSNRRATILTANLNDASKPPEFFDSVQFRLGPRTRSRLLEMCDWVFMDSHDLREIGRDPSEATIEQYNRRMKDLRSQTSDGFKGMAKARLRPSGPADLKWTGGKAGT